MRATLVAMLASVVLGCAPSAESREEANATATPGGSAAAPNVQSLAPIEAGWPTVHQDAVTMTGSLVDEPSTGWAPPAAITIRVTQKGLDPGERVELDGAAGYDLASVGCGIEPSPCTPGSDTTDASVALCHFAYSEPAKGTARMTVVATADGHGAVTSALRFVIPETLAACPVGGGRSWSAESGTWKVRVDDMTHRLRLVAPDVVIGP